MVRVSFLVGAGKLGRQKYDKDLAKTLCRALIALGFDEDQGASCIPQCQGFFKHQHDTGRNLMLLHVFPKITEIAESKGEGNAGGGGGGGGYGGGGGAGGGEADGGESWRDMSPTMMAATASMATFEKMVPAKTPSWTQKKRLLDSLKEVGLQLRVCDEKLISMDKLTAEEEHLYELTSTDELSEKVQWLAAEVKTMVQEKRLTKAERNALVAQLDDKLVEYDTAQSAEGDDATEGGGGGGVLGAAANADTAALTKRREKIRAIAPITHALRREKELLKLYTKVAPLERLEETGRLLEAAEVRKLAAKSDIDDEIEEVAKGCRGTSVVAFQLASPSVCARCTDDRSEIMKPPSH